MKLTSIIKYFVKKFKKEKKIFRSNNPCNEIELPLYPRTLTTPVISNDPRVNLYDPQYSMTGFTGTYISGSLYDADVNTYTIKLYDKDDFQNLVQLLTLWIDNEKIKLSVKEMAASFEGEKFSEEDIDKFILVLSFEINDQKIKSKFEETHQYWKNIKR